MNQSHSDVIVIGGGVVGTSCAYYLRKAGHSVRLIEREHLAWGASGRNAGFIWLSLRPAGVQLDFARAGGNLYPEIIADIGNEFEYRRNGGMIYCFAEDELQVLRELAGRRRADGLAMEVVDGKTARELCPILPDSVTGATFCPEDAQIYTPKFVQALGRAVRGAGVDILEGTGVSGFITAGERITGVETTAGRFTADTTVLATGSWGPMLAETIGLNLPIRPMRLQAVATKPLPPLFDRLLYGPLALKQYTIIRELPSYREGMFRSLSEEGLRHVDLLECMVQRHDGTVMLGLPMDYPGYDQTATLEGVGITAKVFAEHFPQLTRAEVATSWAGLLPSTPDSLPYIGPLPGHEGLIVAAGHVFGNAAGPITGKLVAELVSGVAPSFDMAPFKVDRHQDYAPETERLW
ncbi:glycine/D-amino acid oxidase-like deaminating enzyme [Rhodoligotrophos appendicifer]|uniref:NAD(P)/FAD-dependent oxidoreductase n=1 Tax=Rhodoligotrophos appendicifer TaxID=987056 RepID=UPI0011869D9F|nr:FAD-dependent oxidoreductase [Rhodoligotrophos appendicifer]